MTEETKAKAAPAENPTPPAAPAPSEPRKGMSKTAWAGAAAGIGSAAIVAALLYTRKRP
jgi:hypothetical protein